MSWLDETHGPRFELLRHFIAHMFDSEISPGREWSRVIVGVLSLALPLGMLLIDQPRDPVGLSPEALRELAIVDEVAMLTFLMAATGILALLAWQSLFPSRRDYLAFAGMPVLTFYFPLPSWLIVFLSFVLPYAIAFKLVTVLGILTLPWACFRLGKRAGLAWPEPLFLAAGGPVSSSRSSSQPPVPSASSRSTGRPPGRRCSRGSPTTRRCCSGTPTRCS